MYVVVVDVVLCVLLCFVIGLYGLWCCAVLYECMYYYFK